MLKFLALQVPAIRRLYEERNALALKVAEIREINTRLRAIEGRLNGIERTIGSEAHRCASDAVRSSISLLDLDVRDVLEAVLNRQTLTPLGWEFHAERQLAADTNDHLFPRGTKNDNTRHPRFVRACETLLGADLKHMDIGCAGGGLVWDFTHRGHSSVGVEGSDYSLREQRAAWRTIPDRLFTADICYPFHFTDRSSQRVSFDVISAWELFEHIPEPQLAGLLKNITASLRPGGYLAASIATFVDRDEATGTVYHHTVQPRDWWEKRFGAVGLVPVAGIFEIGDYVRGVGNPTSSDWDVRTNPEMGFHIALRHEPVT
jgi:2-polyprenyl-3-methyl-5-hydroxy-6-metoxy-1,4-benzoquinol methylase